MSPIDPLVNSEVVEAGSFYGEQGEGYLRVCFGSEPYERIEQAMDRLEYFFAGLEVWDRVYKRKRLTNAVVAR